MMFVIVYFRHICACWECVGVFPQSTMNMHVVGSSVAGKADNTVLNYGDYFITV